MAFQRLSPLSLFSFSPITHVVHVTSSNFLEVKLNKCAWKETRSCSFAEESSLYNYVVFVYVHLNKITNKKSRSDLGIVQVK